MAKKKKSSYESTLAKLALITAILTLISNIIEIINNLLNK